VTVRDNRPLPAADRRFRPRRLELAGGETLVLHGSGSIEKLDAAGQVIRAWATDDPAWPGVAIRFGLRAADVTVAPTSRLVQADRLP
jgi:hypothetical protein